MNTLETYRETYKTFSDDELVRTYQDIDDLVELAQIALREELTSRGFDQVKLTVSLKELNRLDAVAALQIPNLRLIYPYGIGRKFFGRKNVSILDAEQMEEYGVTLWFVFLWCPVIPIASYRIRRRRRSWWQRFDNGDVTAIARYSRDWNQVVGTWIKTLLIILTAYLFLHFLISPPKLRRHKSVLYSLGKLQWPSRAPHHLSTLRPPRPQLSAEEPGSPSEVIALVTGYRHSSRA